MLPGATSTTNHLFFVILSESDPIYNNPSDSVHFD